VTRADPFLGVGGMGHGRIKAIHMPVKGADGAPHNRRIAQSSLLAAVAQDRIALVVALLEPISFLLLLLPGTVVSKRRTKLSM
jgi:hypothetical protein